MTQSMTAAEYQATAKRRNPRREEDSLQMAVADWLRVNCPYLLWTHIPNGGHMSPAMGARRKRMGAKAGAPDIVVWFPGGRSLLIELKADKGRLSKSQMDWRARCQDLAVPYVVCRSVEDVEAALVRFAGSES